MLDRIVNELTGRGLGVVIGLAIGTLIAGVIARWRRHQERQSILRGDARDTVVIQHHLVEPGPPTEPGGAPTVGVLRIRSVGQAELNRVVPNGHLEAVFLRRAFAVTTRDTLISMVGAEGSYLLETLTNFVGDRVANGPFDHDLYVMAPCCEPAELSEHQPITILLITVHDLALFDTWRGCRDARVEHGSDGCRVLTLMEMAKRFRTEQSEIARRRTVGERTRHVETMYLLDLALDKRVAAAPIKPIPWGRFEKTLRELNLE